MHVLLRAFESTKGGNGSEELKKTGHQMTGFAGRLTHNQA